MKPELSSRAANWDEEVELLARALPTDLARALHERTDPTELLEIVLDLGREPEARVPGRERIGSLRVRARLPGSVLRAVARGNSPRSVAPPA